MTNCHAITAVCDECGDAHDIATDNFWRLVDRLEEAERERDIYKRAVEHYADRNNWYDFSAPNYYDAGDVGYSVAQAAIREAEGLK